MGRPHGQEERPTLTCNRDTLPLPENRVPRIAYEGIRDWAGNDPAGPLQTTRHADAPAAWRLSSGCSTAAGAEAIGWERRRLSARNPPPRSRHASLWPRTRPLAAVPGILTSPSRTLPE
ncbi:hypothetical protein GCM10010327_16360 [Streptomyces nitrosporeus]|nr:hypothetical protein GCM10010327_16360 [Streptomyces nitrosporeus]